MKRLLAIAILLGSPADAAPPDVVADIAPVHSLVARVMAGAGAPALLLAPGASPHTYAMRPSDAAALAGADLVFWIGEELTPWLSGPLDALAGGARVVALIDQEGTVRHGFREAEGAGAEADHGHDATDPHAWLDPGNARVWLDRIAETLAEADPENAGTYRANAAAAIAETLALEAEIRAELGAARPRHAVHHDAYQYFERRFGLVPAFAVAGSEAVAPGPARIAALRAAARAVPPVCVFSEPQQDTRLVGVVFEGLDVPVLSLDPIGASLEPGPRLYWDLLRGMAGAFAACS